MKVKALEEERLEDFKNYCRKHKNKVDNTYLHEDEDLKDFQPDEENPTYTIEDYNGEIVAAASLVINDYHRRGKRGRFRIFHSEIKDVESYKALHKAILRHAEGLERVFLHLSIHDKNTIGYFEKLNYNVERYSFLLMRGDMEVSAADFPEDYEVRKFRLGTDEEVWCGIRNVSFAKLKGSETPITPEMITEAMTAVDHIEGGAMLLYHKERPVGIVRGTTDDYKDSPVMAIGPIAIIPEYQGKGLGRSLLRTSLRFAEKIGYKRVILSVNAENERAKALYVQEGFKEVTATVCYKYDL